MVKVRDRVSGLVKAAVGEEIREKEETGAYV